MSSNEIIIELNKYYTVWQEYNYVYELWAKAHNLSVNSLLVLLAIYDGENHCTQGKISQRWMIPKQTVNMVLKDFEKRGFVKFLPMQEDKRNKLIRFTQKGYKYADGIISELRESELCVIEQMGLERMKQLNDNFALFVSLFRETGGDKKNETVS